MKFELRLLGAALALWTAAGSAYAQTPERFDMVCSGTQKETDPKLAGVKPWTNRYSIDLGAKQYCPGEGASRCKAPQPIKSIEPHRLRLSENWMVPDTRYQYVKQGAEQEISRADGSFKSRLIIPGITNMSVEAKCTLAEFTPFPATMF